MRVLTSAIGVLLLSVALAAQAPEPTPAPPERGTIGLPLPPIGLPHPPTGLPPMRSPARRDDARTPERARGQRQRPVPVVSPWPVGWLVLEPAAMPQPPASSKTTNGEAPSTRPGRLRVVVEPRVVQQVFVDGYYVGDADAAREGFELDGGTHMLEVRAEGYETLAVPVQMEADRSISYRGRLSLAPQEPAQEPGPATTAGAGLFYVIPGCYVGNVPPEDAGLPSSCDLTKAVAVRP